MGKEFRLTTIDNPYNPFTQFVDWNAFDVDMGYNTLAFLGRVVQTSENFSGKDEESAREEAIDEIIKYNVLGLYKKVYKE